MRTFRVTINGEVYQVEVEELGGGIAQPPQGPVVIAGLAPQVVAGSSRPKALLLDDAGTVNSPMPGTINQVYFQVGDQVKTGDVLFILEAMKMENLIKADIDGVVKEIRVTKGQAVNSGDPLAIIA